MYGITSRCFKYWHLSPRHDHTLPEYYNRKKLKTWVLSPESTVYGFVLVRYKSVRSGISIKIKLKWRDWRWTPVISWRFGKHLHWLCFMSWIEFDYTDVPDKIVRDHLKERENDDE